MAECMAEIGLRREMKFLLDKIDIENIDFYPAKSAIALYRQFGVDESFECLRHPNICIEGMHALITHLALQGDYYKTFLYLQEIYPGGISHERLSSRSGVFELKHGESEFLNRKSKKIPFFA